MAELSIVLITKNQAWNIARLIESVLDATSSVLPREIILVDSASTDQTVEIAGRYPVTVLRLKSGQRLSPAIGRYVGYRWTNGRHVLFLDGDTELLPGWLPRAFHLLSERPDVGAVTGSVINLPTAAADKKHSPEPCPEPLCSPQEVLWCSYGGGGAALYRRSALEAAGTFNPYLNAEEEPELGLRIRHAGFRLFTLDYPIVRHYNDAPIAFSSVWSRRRRNFHLGMGQAARNHFGTKLFWQWMRERWWEPLAAFLLASGVAAALLSLLMRRLTWFEVWFAGLGVLLGYVALQKRTIKGALVSFFSWLVMAEGFLRGILMKPLPAEKFHPDVELVRNPAIQTFAESAM